MSGRISGHTYGVSGRQENFVSRWSSVGRRSDDRGRRVGCQNSGIGSVHGCQCEGEEKGGNQCQKILLESHVDFFHLDLVIDLEHWWAKVVCERRFA